MSRNTENSYRYLLLFKCNKLPYFKMRVPVFEMEIYIMFLELEIHICALSCKEKENKIKTH